MATCSGRCSNELKYLGERPAIFEGGGNLIHIERDRFFRVIQWRIILLVEPFPRILLFDLLGLDTLFALVAQDLLEDPGAVPGQGLAQADDLVHQVERQLARHLQQTVERRHGDPRIVQGAVRGGQQNAKLLSQRAQVIAAGSGHQYRG